MNFSDNTLCFYRVFFIDQLTDKSVAKKSSSINDLNMSDISKE